MHTCLRPSSYALLVVMALAVTTPLQSQMIWVEGEDAVASTMRGHNWYNSVKTAELSGNDWLSHFGNGDMPVARFEFDASAAGPYELWLRANPIASAISVRVNGGTWTKVALQKHEQSVNIAADGKPDLRYVAWIKADSVSLSKGKNTLEVRFESDNNRHGGLDCFVLSREPFLPQGKLRPGEKTGLADPGTWAFEPARDSFSPDSLLDLSGMNEKPAGAKGRVARSSDGESFVDGGGEPLRFWAVNTSVQNRDDIAAIREHARWLAKRGVNMVRHHGHLAPQRGAKLDDANTKDIEAAWRLVAAMKEQGIYVTLSPYWAVSVKPDPAWGLKDAGGENLTGLLFFDAKLQAAFKQWLKQLLTPPNPHTGIPLAQDPALAIFQIQNEDSLLFWTENAIQGEQRVELGRQFAGWLKSKHGSLDNAVRVWGGSARCNGDDFANGIVMPHQIWQLTQDHNGAMAKRLADQLAFYTERMRDFNLSIAKFLKEEIGYDGLINAGNWRTADQAKLLDAERYAYSANDVIGVNRYYTGGSHTNPTDNHRAGYLISRGDLFDGTSALLQPWAFPLALRQVSGHPMIVSESAWVPPLRYQTEGPFLVAAYGAMSGVDIFYWFATDQIGFGPPMEKWQLSTPAQIGMFPAAAMMFRQGYIQEGKPALVESRNLSDVFNRKPPLLPEEAGFDPNRDTQLRSTNAEDARQGTITSLAYLAGPVEVAFDNGETQLADISSLIDTNKQTVRSITGELAWNYGDGYCTLNAAKAQGATGNLAAAGTIKLDTLTLRCDNDYATVFAVSMDGVNLSESKQVLLQIGTVARPHGWKTEPAQGGKSQRIVDLGSSPWNIENTSAEVVVSNSVLSQATSLDANGIATANLLIQKNADGLSLKLPPNALYILLR
ncbi:hypothetical protein SH528x_006500 [Novipirellula sp. SH528]|uniref:hypothetical protein n=1 Tax=Novipirellula sp. SH528 TaxID=3454466 RepID=UPI003F9FC024